MIRFRSFAAFLAAFILLFTALPAEGSDYDVMEMEKEFEQIDRAGSWAAIYQVRERPGALQAFPEASRAFPSHTPPPAPVSLCVPPSASAPAA